MIKVLLVDDEPFAIRSIKGYLNWERMGLTLVGEAKNGSDALLVLQSESCPNIVITDMNMPVMNGVSLLKYIADNHPDVLTIVISGYVDFQYTGTAIRTGTQDYLLKPIDADELVAAVSRSIDKLKMRTLRGEGSPFPFLMNEYVSLDLEQYRLLLDLEVEVAPILRHGKPADLAALVKRIETVLRVSDEPDALALAAIQLFWASVLRFVVENRLPVPEIRHIDQTGLPILDAAIQILHVLLAETTRSLSAQKAVECGGDAVENIKQYIDREYRSQLRCADLAMRFHISKEYLSTTFHNRYGETIGNHITNLRMRDAVLLLMHSNLPVYGIAAAVGYADENYFHRVFKKKMGVSAQEYRKLSVGGK